MTVIVAILWYVFGLDAATGTLKFKCDTLNPNLDIDINNDSLEDNTKKNTELNSSTNTTSSLNTNTTSSTSTPSSTSDPQYQ